MKGVIMEPEVIVICQICEEKFNSKEAVDEHIVKENHRSFKFDIEENKYEGQKMSNEERKTKTNHPGWKPEGFMRKQLTMEDAIELIHEITGRVPQHFESYGAGIFTHPHEITGCMFGQIVKLSKAADESIYTGDLKDFRERCVKTLMAIFVGLASVDKLAELRKDEEIEEGKIGIQVVINKGGKKSEHNFQYNNSLPLDLKDLHGLDLEEELAKFVREEIIQALRKS